MGGRPPSRSRSAHRKHARLRRRIPCASTVYGGLHEGLGAPVCRPSEAAGAAASAGSGAAVAVAVGAAVAVAVGAAVAVAVGVTSAGIGGGLGAGGAGDAEVAATVLGAPS